MALSPNLLPLPPPPSSSLADLMKPSLQMKHNFKDRNVVRRSRMIYAPGGSLAAVSLITSDANKGLEHLGPGSESLWACQGSTWASLLPGHSQPVATVKRWDFRAMGPA